MGLYETVLVPCPECGERYPAQSKSGPCEMAYYTLEDAPDAVVLDVNRHAPFNCERCSTVFEVELFVPETRLILRKAVAIRKEAKA